jgi:hypothetical protein
MGTFGAKIDDFLAFLDNFEIQFCTFFCEIQNWSGFASIAYGVYIDTFLVGLCAEMGLNMQ